MYIAEIRIENFRSFGTGERALPVGSAPLKIVFIVEDGHEEKGVGRTQLNR